MARPKKTKEVTVEQAEKALAKANKAHQSYYVDGKKVKGCTSLINEHIGWNKNVLVAWARREALEGRDPDKVRDAAGNIGTLVHGCIEANLLGVPFDATIYSAAELVIADKCMTAFHKWRKDNNPEIIAVEKQMTSALKMYGATCDLICNINHAPVVIDWKTSSNIYPEYIIQGGAIMRVVWESYPDVFDWDNIATWPNYHAISINKQTGMLLEHIYTGETLHKAWLVFEHVLALEALRKHIQ